MSKIVSSYLKKNTWLVLLSVLIVACDVGLTLLPPFMLKYIVDDIIQAGKTEELERWAVFYTLAYIALGIFEFLKSVILIKVSQGICKELRIGLLNRVRIMDYECLSSYDVGTMESLFNNDVNTINTLISNGVISMMIDLFKMLGVFVSVFFFSTNIGYLLLCIVPFIAAFIVFVRHRMFKAQLKTKEMEANVNQQVLENIDNIESIQTYVSYDYINGRYEETIKNHFDAQNVSMFYDSLFSPVMQMSRYTLIAVILIISVQDPTVFGVSIGAFLSLIDLISDLFSPMENIGMELQTLQTSAASIHRINDFIKKRPRDIDPKLKVDALPGNNSLSFSHVNYSYDGKATVIKDFSLNIGPTEKITIKGESGVGKSTLFKLGYGLLVPRSGNVTINGSEANRLSEESRRRLFGIVYQDPFFSMGTIREEITLGETDFTDEKIFAALKAVGLSRIKNLDILLKESDYSSGELALFNIARIILRNPPIIFLDEMNAKIDPETALRIIALLNDYAKDHMILSITHYGTQLKNSKELTLTLSEKN
jgi:ATP-binding cassette subfamily B protein